MSSPTGILAFGAYIPQRRLQRSAVYAANSWFAPNLKGQSKGERAIACWDEDTVTMAVEASRDCLTGLDRTAIAGISLASTTLPYADRLNSGLVKEALCLETNLTANDQTGSLRAGTSALIQALNGTAPQLVVAADLRKARPASEGELVQGDAAAAILVGQAGQGLGEIAATFLGSHSVTIDFVDHFRSTSAEFD